MTTEATPSPTPEQIHAGEQAILKRYWESNIRVMGILLFIWAFVGLGCGILLADVLNPFELPGTGYPLGFWFAQQGAIVTFVLLILVYALLMNRLDRVHHQQRAELLGEADEPQAYTGEGI